MPLPDHVDVIGELEQGGQYRYSVSAAIGHAPNRSEVRVFGTEGTVVFAQDNAGKSQLLAGKRGDPALHVVPVPGDGDGWRVEEEFINAIRGVEPVTYTDFVLGTKYME